MKYRDFEIIRDKTASEPTYNVVKWLRQGNGLPPECLVIARLLTDPLGEWRFISIGTRFLDYYEDGLVEFVRNYVRILTVYKSMGGDK